jgi:cold shock protein
MKEQGKVKWFKNDKGYGYISSAFGDVFVHYSAIQGEGYKRLDKGDRVEFELFRGPKGYQARDVRHTGNPKPNPKPSASPLVKNGTREQGTVRWFKIQKGYGFIARASGDDIFVHISAVQGNGSKLLKGGDPVEFEIAEGPHGPQANNVSRALKSQPAIRKS